MLLDYNKAKKQLESNLWESGIGHNLILLDCAVACHWSVCTLSHFQVAIPIDDFYGSHLKFHFKHRSSIDGGYMYSTVEHLYSTIGGVHEMRSCYRRIMVK